MPNTLVEILPTSMDLLHRTDQPRPSGWSRALVEKLLQQAARSVAHADDRRALHFSIVNSARKWQDIRRLRLHTYTHALPYMQRVVNHDGVDAYDARSVVFGAWYGDEAIATVRLTAWPFEMATLLPANEFAELVPDSQRLDTLEFSRLISAKHPHCSRVMPALIGYAGMSLALNTGCRHYIGYTKTAVSRIFSKFMCASALPPFVIPDRGEHTYQVLKGDFRQDAHKLLDEQARPRLVAQAVKWLM